MTPGSRARVDTVAPSPNLRPVGQVQSSGFSAAAQVPATPGDSLLRDEVGVVPKMLGHDRHSILWDFRYHRGLGERLSSTP